MLRNRLLSTQKALLPINRDGFSLIEVILAIGIFALIITFVMGALSYGQNSTAISGTRNRANLLAEEGLEAVRNMADASFTNLTDGAHGLSVSSNQWTFSGTSDITDIFTRSVTISSIDSNTKEVISTITWQQTAQRSGNISLSTYLTHWNTPYKSQNLIVNTTGAKIGGGDKELQEITIKNTGSSSITIDKITVTWNNPYLMEEIKMGGTTTWKHDGVGTPDDKQQSGTEFDISNFTLPANSATIKIDRFKWNGNMKNTGFIILFTMTDGSTKEASAFESFLPCPNQAAELTINTSGVSMNKDGRELKNMTIQNTNSTCSITLDKITVTWNNSSLIEEIKISKKIKWKHNGVGTPDGKQPSGTELNIEDFPLYRNSGAKKIDKFRWNGDMSESTFTIVFKMSDGTTKSVTYP